MKKGFLMKQTIFAMLFALLLEKPAIAVSFDYSMYNHKKKYTCEFKKCFKLDEIVKGLKANNYDVQDKLQTLIQTRLQVKVKMARLFPSFDVSKVASLVAGDFSGVASLVGFLFPCNWFDWKESKLFYLAQRQSYKTILANQIITGIELFYILHQESIDANILKHYYGLLENIETFCREELKKSVAGISEYELDRILTFKSEIKIKIIFLENAFKGTFPLIANLMTLQVDSRWDLSSIELHSLPDLDQYEKKDQNAFYQEVLQLSPELMTIDYLLSATEYTKKIRIFSFLGSSQEMDDGLGGGYISRIKIVKSEKKQLEIKKEKTASLLQVRVHGLILNHNAAIDIYNEAILGGWSAKRLLDKIFKDYEITKQLDIEQVIEVLQAAMALDLNRNFSQHYYFLSRSHFDRMMFQGKYFNGIDQLIPKKEKLDDFSSLRKAREDKKIEKAIREKKLKI